MAQELALDRCSYWCSGACWRCGAIYSGIGPASSHATARSKGTKELKATPRWPVAHLAPPTQFTRCARMIVFT